MKAESVKFELGQIIYSKIAPELTGQITGILFRPNGVMYLVTWSDDLEEKYHHEIELTADKSFIAEKEEDTK